MFSNAREIQVCSCLIVIVVKFSEYKSLEYYSCNKYCALVGQLEVSISDRNLQVSDRDLQVFVAMGMEKMHGSHYCVETITMATIQNMATTASSFGCTCNYLPRKYM